MIRLFLFSLAAAFLASCSDSLVEVESPEAVEYSWPVSVTCDFYSLSGTVEVSASNFAFPVSSSWEVSGSLPTLFSPDQQLVFSVDSGDGYFTFSTLESVGAVRDSISGSGFFSADTIYFSYSFRSLSDTSVVGFVSVHSL